MKILSPKSTSLTLILADLKELPPDKDIRRKGKLQIYLTHEKDTKILIKY